MSLSGPAVMCKVKRFFSALPVPSHYSLPNGEVSRVMQLRVNNACGGCVTKWGLFINLNNFSSSLSNDD